MRFLNFFHSSRFKSGRLLQAVAVALLGLHVGLAAPAHAENIVFPAGAGVLKVTSAPYNAVPNDSGDDTAAIQAALTAANRTGRVVYLPNGTYIVSDTLKWSHGDLSYNEGWGGYAQMQGQSRAGTIIKLKSNCAGFTSAATRKPVIKTASEDGQGDYSNGEGNQAFENHIRNLTVDVGSGNLGAIGIFYQASNVAALRDVTIKSSDATKRGAIGLALYGNDNGPGLIKNVSIDGFDSGVQLYQEINTFVFEHLTLSNQKGEGIWCHGAVIGIRDLVSTNTVPVVNMHGNGVLNLLGATLTGGSSANSAIMLRDSESRAFLRDITSSGYASAVNNRGTFVSGANQAEWVSDGIHSLFPSPQTSLRLPVEETPTYFSTTSSDWVSVVAKGATVNNSSDDDSAGIQAAMNFGKPVVYFPAGRYHVGTTINVPPSVRLVVGFGGAIEFKTVLSPLFKVSGGGTSNTTIFDNMQWQSNGNGSLGVRQDDTRTLVLRDLTGPSMYSNTVAGAKLFVEDVVSGGYAFNFPLKVWARQWNTEGPDSPKVLNKGGTVWCLGWKSEGRETQFDNQNGGQIEAFSGLAYSDGVNSSTPLFINTESSMVASFANAAYYGSFDLLVKETRGGEVREKRRGSVIDRAGGSVVPLYVGYGSGPTPAGTGTGLTGKYYSDKNLTTLVQTQIDATVDFDWGTGQPQYSGGGNMSSVGPDNFSVRWTGQLQAIEAGTYTITTTSDDGVRLYLNGATTPQIDKWFDQGPTPYSTTVSLTAGQKIDVTMDYYDAGGGAVARLSWIRPGASTTVAIPMSQLYPTAGGGTGTVINVNAATRFASNMAAMP